MSVGWRAVINCEYLLHLLLFDEIVFWVILNPLLTAWFDDWTVISPFSRAAKIMLWEHLGTEF